MPWPVGGNSAGANRLHYLPMNNPSEVPAHRYSPELAGVIEKKWQTLWRENGTFQAPNPVGTLATGAELPSNKLFVQDMFPFPSGAGLHVGHPLGSVSYTHLTLPTICSV